MQEFHIPSTEKEQIMDITETVEAIVGKSGIKEGFCLVYVPHTTASIIVLEADGAVEKDILNSLSAIVPKNKQYNHDPSAPGHGASHVKSAFLGPSRLFPVSEGCLKLGTWQHIAICEFDGPRERHVIVELVGK